MFNFYQLPPLNFIFSTYLLSIYFDHSIGVYDCFIRIL